MSRPFKLFRLQQLDSQLDGINHRLVEIETALKEDTQLRLAMQAAEQADQAHQKAFGKLQNAEREVRLQRLKIEQNESSLYGGKIRNPKELKDLENEVASLKRYLEVLEDRQLEAMMTEEDSLGVKQQTLKVMETAQIEFQQRSAELIQEKEKTLKDMTRLEVERQAAAEAVEPGDLSIYMQIRKTRRGIAVARVTDKACSACGSTLNATLLDAAHSPNQLHNCDNCGRILYTG